MKTSRYLIAAAILFVSLDLPFPSFAQETPFYPVRDQLLVLRDGEGEETAIKTPEDWRRRRAHILGNLELVMGPLPDASRVVPLDVKVDEEVRTEKFLRRKLTFAVEKGDRLPAYLLIPHERNGRLPAVLCLHTTHRELGGKIPAGIGSKDDRFAYAVHLAERGYVTLSPDYPYMGEYQHVDPYQLGYASTTMKAIWNHMRCVDLLQSLAEVDPERIGVIGHSLGGHNSMFVAAFDERIKCVVSNAGFCSFPTYQQGT